MVVILRLLLVVGLNEDIRIEIEKSVARGIKKARWESATELSEYNDNYLKLEVERLSPLPTSPLVTGGDAFITTADLWLIVEKSRSNLGNSIDEHKLIVFFTPLLDSVLQSVYPDSMLLNSEEYKWIKCHDLFPKNNLKPDLSVVLKGLQVDKAEPDPPHLKRLRATELPNYEFKFGYPNWAFLDGLKVVIEWKGKIEPLDFVAMYRYLLHLSFERDDILFHGLLCDSKGFYVFECISKRIRENVRWYLWDKPGSLDAIKVAFSPNCQDSKWATLLRHALSSDLSIQLTNSDAFLGGGAFGRVFKVLDNNGNERALKIVLTHRHSKHTPQQLKLMCCNEFNAMEDLQMARQYVVAPVADSLKQFIHEDVLFGMYYLLQEVGRPVDKEIRQEVKLAFRALAGIHNVGRYHGDARIVNSVIVSSAAKWVDFIQYLVKDYNIFSCKEDLSHFFESVIGGSAIHIDQTLLQQYFSDPLAYCEIIFQSLFP